MKTKQEVLLCGFSAQELCGAWQLWHLGQLRFLIDLIPIILWWNLKRKSRSSLLAYDYLFILCLDPVVAKIDDRCKTNTVIRHCPPFCPVEYVIIQCSVVLCWSHQLFTHVNNAPVDLTCACAVTDKILDLLPHNDDAKEDCKEIPRIKKTNDWVLPSSTAVRRKSHRHSA